MTQPESLPPNSPEAERGVLGCCLLKVAKTKVTRHEEEGAFAVEMILRNLPPVAPFVVRWKYPVFVRADSLDPTHLKSAAGRPTTYKAEMLLECLGSERLSAKEWQKKTSAERGVSRSRFFTLLQKLEEEGKVAKSVADEKWEQIRPQSRNWHDEKDQ